MTNWLTDFKTKFKRMRRMFRNLYHRHRYDLSNSESITVDLTGGRHTSFLLLKCSCGEKTPFPEDNFKIALHQGTEETKKYLADLVDV